MAKITQIILLTILSVFTFSLSYSQDESLTITTYYPSPYGSYHELHSDQMTIGSSYRSGVTPPTDGLVIEGNVGIGTTVPMTKMEVRGTSLFTKAALGSNGNPSTNANLADLAVGQYIKGYGPWTTNDNSLQSTFVISSEHRGGWDTRVTIGTNNGHDLSNREELTIRKGNVGIGTTSPEIYGSGENQHQAKLDIAGYSATNDVWLRDAAGGSGGWASSLIANASGTLNIHGIYHKEFGGSSGSFTLPVPYPIIAVIPIAWHYYDRDSHMARAESNISITISSNRKEVSWSGAIDSGIELYILY